MLGKPTIAGGIFWELWVGRVTTVTAPWCGTGPENIAFCCVGIRKSGCGKNGWASRPPPRTPSSKFFSHPDIRSSVGRVFRNSSAQLLLLCPFVCILQTLGTLYGKGIPGGAPREGLSWTPVLKMLMGSCGRHASRTILQGAVCGKCREGAEWAGF